MHPLFNGIYLGLFLAVLVGPIIFVLIQAGIERGFRAGAMIGFGMWVGDLLFILLAYFGLSYLQKVTQWPGFELTLGIIGGIILFVLGLASISRAPPEPEKKPGISGDYFTLWLKGFLINSFNPFTIFFWIIITTTIVTENYIEGSRAAWFFVGIMATVIITDCLKVILAKGFRKWLTRSHIILVRRMSGIILLVFSLVLIARVLLRYMG